MTAISWEQEVENVLDGLAEMDSDGASVKALTRLAKREAKRISKDYGVSLARVATELYGGLLEYFCIKVR